MSDFDELTRSIYQSAIEPENWSDVLRQVAGRFDAAGSTMFVSTDRFHSIQANWGWNVPSDGMDEYVNDIVRRDPRMAHLKESNFLGVYYDYLHTNEAEMDRHPYYDWLARMGDFRYYMAKPMTLPGGIMAAFTIQRDRRQGHIDQAHIAEFDLISAHIECALEMSRRLGEANVRSRDFGQALDGVADAIFWVTRNARVVHMNRRARDLVSSGGTVTMCHGSLRGRTPDDTAALEKEVARAAQLLEQPLDAPRPRSFVLSRDESGARVAASASPVTGHADRFISGEAEVILVIGDRSAPPPMAELLCELFDLTATEAELALALSDGDTIQQFSSRTSRSPATARWHLKHILAKTGTSTQAQLVSLVLKSLPP